MVWKPSTSCACPRIKSWMYIQVYIEYHHHHPNHHHNYHHYHHNNHNHNHNHHQITIIIKQSSSSTSSNTHHKHYRHHKHGRYRRYHRTSQTESVELALHQVLDLESWRCSWWLRFCVPSITLWSFSSGKWGWFIHIYTWFFKQWWFSTAMLNDQRVWGNHTW